LAELIDVVVHHLEVAGDRKICDHLLKAKLVEQFAPGKGLRVVRDSGLRTHTIQLPLFCSQTIVL
jgi:hypothetical protein